MLNLAVRNIKLYFRDKTSVFFSLLGVFVIIGLYVLFLGDQVEQSVGELPGARFLMDSWIMGGVIAVTAITTTMGAFGQMVDDKVKKNYKDIYASPLKRYKIAGGYLISSYIVGVIMSLLTFLLAELYIVLSGGELLPFNHIIKVIGIILISVLASSAMIFFMVSLFKTNNSFATASTVVGTLMGFLMGIYIPIGVLPSSVQTFIKAFPLSHSGTLLRQIFMEVPISVTFKGIPLEEVEKFKSELGVVYKVGDEILTPSLQIGFLLITAVVFYLLAILSISRKNK
ncbi:ABC transporter permease [Alloiococcus sp. CFN-8]|uniref:ABC transporter permease n=1 Tax=Alloiococcus sp. CFN-8 TaxID=3416081 RepID=UPI003CEAF87B